MSKIKILSEEDHSMKVLVSNSDRSFVNALRRTMIADVPKFAIDSMRIELGMFKDEESGEYYESNYAISDEQLAHRFAMLPIPTFHSDFYFQEECPSCMDLVEDQKSPNASQQSLKQAQSQFWMESKVQQ